ncbi:uncharacterized protein N7459_008251 [Penicillium hispanicum]|uniref:uncharacterized protein n=1 Tax=Penicillium hispanicum TaxID=1080232 RepID=UPI002540727F|nr:uncharacterized protein N7459_008251 [Penicillium hispanicum]KAJ5573824.1 hypothetical protein N7459_008251 [Penicillium hispanicum]
MDSPNMSLSLPHTSPFPTSPSAGPRKRSIHEVDEATVAPINPKRTLTDYSGENQENRDPILSQTPKGPSTPSGKQTLILPPPPSVEIPVQKINLEDYPPAFSPPVDATSPSLRPKKEAVQPSPIKSDMSTPTAKKQKVSPAGKEAKQQEKETKERQKLEEKLRKDEEKAKKEEEKRLKADEKKKRDAEREEEKRLKEEEKKKREAEREEKKKAKEEEKAAKEAAKEDEKRRKEEEKLKKERAQPKLNSFFAKPQLPSASSAGVKLASPGKASSQGDVSTDHTVQPPKSDYAKEFPEFFLLSHTVVAPVHRFERDSKALEHVRQSLDVCMNPNDTTSQHHSPHPFRPSEIFNLIPYRRHRGRQAHSVKDILLKMQNENDETLQPQTKPGASLKHNPRDLLRKVPMKSLKFCEDVRPSYQGTFTRPVPESSVIKVSRNPYRRAIPDINYDYDSEAEWEEPEEGEDLDSEEEEEGSDDGDDDMDGFLDDEDDALAGGKRRLIVGDLEPVCSGIQWAADGVEPEFKAYQIETISDAVRFPIDPFSTAYWQKPRAPEPPKGSTAQNPSNRTQTLDAFRVNNGSDTPAVGSALPASLSKAKRPFPPELLEQFKQVVEASDLSKIGTVEILKKRFPKVSKETLKATLDQLAVRVGQKEADKKWIFR